MPRKEVRPELPLLSIETLLPDLPLSVFSIVVHFGRPYCCLHLAEDLNFKHEGVEVPMVFFFLVFVLLFS